MNRKANKRVSIVGLFMVCLHCNVAAVGYICPSVRDISLSEVLLS